MTPSSFGNNLVISMTPLKTASIAVLLLAALAAPAIRAADKANEPDNAQVDAIVRKLESSGALDAAVDRAIVRYVQRKQKAQQQHEEQVQAQIAARIPPFDAKRDHVRGTPGAEITMIEYTDFECPFCKRFHDTPRAMLDRYKGRVNWVIRDFPLPFHEPAAGKEALAAECVARLAGNDAYWKYADALFANTKSNGEGLPPEHSVEKLAATLGVDAQKLDECMKDPSIAERVDRDVREGKAAGIGGTPTTILRNVRTGHAKALVGAVPETDLSRTIDELLAAPR